MHPGVSAGRVRLQGGASRWWGCRSAGRPGNVWAGWLGEDGRSVRDEEAAGAVGVIVVCCLTVCRS